MCELALVSLVLLTERGTFCRGREEGGDRRGASECEVESSGFASPGASPENGQEPNTPNMPSIRLFLCLIKLDAYADNCAGKPSCRTSRVIMIESERERRDFEIPSRVHAGTFSFFRSDKRIHMGKNHFSIICRRYEIVDCRKCHFVFWLS